MAQANEQPKHINGAITAIIVASLIGATGYAWTRSDSTERRVTVVEVKTEQMFALMQGYITEARLDKKEQQVELKELRKEFQELARVIRSANGR